MLALYDLVLSAQRVSKQ